MPSSVSRASADPGAGGAFRVQLVVGGCGVAATAAAVVATAESVHRRTAGAHRLVIDGQAVTYPAVNVAAGVLLALAVVGAVVLVAAVREGRHQLRGSRRFVRRLRVVGTLTAHPAASVVDGHAPEAFFAGLLRPRVYVSRGAVAALDDAQLRAVLDHEDHHRRRRDPLRLACARVLGQALFFLPVLRPLGERHAHLAEIDADRAAVRARPGGRASLAAALLAFDAGAPRGAGGISPDRVDALLGAPPRWRVPGALAVLAVATLAGLAVVVWQASRDASATASLGLPLLSSQPCVLALALVPLAAWLAGVAIRR